MQFLGVPPRAVIAVFTKLVHHQTHILQVEDARFRMPEPKAFWMAAHQSRRACAQLRRRRCGRRHFLQLIRLGSHITRQSRFAPTLHRHAAYHTRTPLPCIQKDLHLLGDFKQIFHRWPRLNHRCCSTRPDDVRRGQCRRADLYARSSEAMASAVSTFRIDFRSSASRMGPSSCQFLIQARVCAFSPCRVSPLFEDFPDLLPDFIEAA